MVGKDIVAYCPICKRIRHYHVSIVSILKYKNENYYLIYCNDCKNKILVKDLSITTLISNELSIGFINIKDDTKERIIALIINEFKNKNYNEKTPEEQIEKEMFSFVKKIKGEVWCSQYEYEIKSIIQAIMSKNFNVPTTNIKSYIYEDVVEDCVIAENWCF